MRSIYSIITGDIVKSRLIAPADREKLYSNLTQFLTSLQKKKWLSAFETYRGDSIQCETKKPEMALRVALIIRCFFKSYLPGKTPKTTKGYFNSLFDIRLGIGLGSAEFIHKKDISRSDGEAFRLSGEALDQLKESSQKLALLTINEDFNEQMALIILLTDALIEKWTQNQAEIVLHKLLHKKDEDIAELLKISTSAVTQRKKNAQWPAIEQTIIYFEKTIQPVIA